MSLCFCSDHNNGFAVAYVARGSSGFAFFHVSLRYRRLVFREIYLSLSPLLRLAFVPLVFLGFFIRGNAPSLLVIIVRTEAFEGWGRGFSKLLERNYHLSNGHLARWEYFVFRVLARFLWKLRNRQSPRRKLRFRSHISYFDTGGSDLASEIVSFGNCLAPQNTYKLLNYPFFLFESPARRNYWILGGLIFFTFFIHFTVSLLWWVFIGWFVNRQVSRL